MKVTPIERIRRDVLSLLTAVSSPAVRYRLHEIHERLADTDTDSRKDTVGPSGGDQNARSDELLILRDGLTYRR